MRRWPRVRGIVERVTRRGHLADASRSDAGRDDPTAKTWRLYAVKLREDARERVLARMRPLDRSRIDRRLPLVYVGVTALTPKKRYERHREGGITSAAIVRDHGVGLLESLYRDRNPLNAETEAQALEAEAAFAEELRDRGYAVWGEHGKPLRLERP